MSNVKQLQVKGAALNAPLSLRILADQIESGEIEAASVFVVWQDENKSFIDARLFGRDMSISEGMGLLLFAANSLYQSRNP